MGIFDWFKVRKLVNDLSNSFTPRGWDEDVQSEAIKGLGIIGGKRAVEVLINILNGGGVIASDAAEALGKIGEPAVEPLIRVLNLIWDDLIWGDQRSRIYALVCIGEPAVEPLIQVLKEGENNAKEYAAEALGEIGDERAVEPLIQVLKNEHKSTLKEAIGALGKLKWTPKDDFERAYYLMCKNKWQKIVTMGESAVEPLIEVLGVGDYDIDENAAKTLKMIGESAVEPLIEALNYDDIDIQKFAAEALGNIGDERAVKPLIQALNDDYALRRNAAKALGNIGDERAVEPLIQALKYHVIHIDRWAAEALGKIGDERAVEPLVQIMKEYDYNDYDIRNSGIDAAEALVKIGKKIGNERTVELFIKALKDEDWMVRANVETALRTTGPKWVAQQLVQALNVSFKRWE